jgi:predicted RNA-binding Zn-ribbon protein involved in translation (DUF1610 family)
VPKVCDEKHVRETLLGVGPCRIAFEVLKRNGKPNWWCLTHGMEASAPDGAALDRCPGAWFDSVPEELQLEVEVTDGQVAVWGVVPAAILIGHPPNDSGKVHVHHRTAAGGAKDIDSSFDIVRLHHDDRELVIEGMAAVAFSLSELAGREVTQLTCPRCGGRHIDELKFATYPHRKHVCNACGRNFWDSSGPSISNPLANAYEELSVPPPAAPQPVDRPLDLDRSHFRAIMIWPSNSAILSTMRRAEEVGIHVHAWDATGQLVLDETFSPVSLDGVAIEQDQLRALAVQRALAHGAPILAVPCNHCGASLVSPRDGWIEATTTHTCSACGDVSKTRRKVFLNPLADKP